MHLTLRLATERETLPHLRPDGIVCALRARGGTSERTADGKRTVFRSGQAWRKLSTVRIAHDDQRFGVNRTNNLTSRLDSFKKKRVVCRVLAQISGPRPIPIRVPPIQENPTLGRAAVKILKSVCCRFWKKNTSDFHFINKIPCAEKHTFDLS